MHRISGLLTPEQLDQLDELLDRAAYADGRATAGGAGQSIKSNLQVQSMDQFGSQANQLVLQALQQHEEFKMYALPLKITNITFARYTEGMSYGNHTDNALNWTPQQVIRSDLSFTIFLSDPDDYEGGELVANLHGEELAIKYGRGDMVIYPSGLPHHVNEVSSGVRQVAIGWAQSTILEQDHREILHAVYSTRNEILVREGRSEHFLRLDFAYSNLMRLWSRV